MNILITISKGLGHGGAEVTVSQLAEEFIKMGHNVIFASSADYPSLKVERFKFVEKYPFFIQHLYLVRFFKNIIKKYNIDIVHAQDRTTVIPAIIAARKCSIPVVAHSRDYWFACPKSTCLKPNYSECIHYNWQCLFVCFKWYNSPLTLYKILNIKRAKKYLNKADAKIVVSSTVKKKLEDCGIKNNIHIVAGARIFEQFENLKGIEEFREKYKLREIVVTFIGGFSYTKGILEVFKFMPEILKENRNVSLLLVGDGVLYNDVIKKIKEYNLEEQIILTGYLPYNQIPLCCVASDILIAPHLWSEPLGATILEASAASKPFVISDKGGTSDFKNTFEYIIPPENIALWKEKILFLINNPSERKRLGKKSRENIEPLSMKAYAKNIEQIYIKLLK